MPSLQEVLAEINGLIDAEALLRLINYYPDKISRSDSKDKSGSNLKGFCPIHKEKAFRSLLVNEEQRRFTCTYLKCIGRSGGTLIELYALVQNLNQTSAALELVQRLNLQVEPSLFDGLSMEIAEKSALSMQAGNCEQAFIEIEQACAIHPLDSGLLRMKAQILRQMDRSEEALQTELRVADLFIEQGDPDAAVELLDGLHAANPDLTELTDKLVQVLGDAGLIERRTELLRETCERILAASKQPENLEPFELYLQADPEEQVMRRKVAEFYQERKDPKKAAEHWEHLVRAQIKTGQGRKALASLEQLESLGLRQRAIRALKVSALHLTGETGKAGEELQALAEEALADGNLSEAIDFLEQSRIDNPENIEMILKIASIAEQQGDTAKSVASLIAAANMHQQRNEFSVSFDLLKKAASLSPEDEGVSGQIESLCNDWISSGSISEIHLAGQVFDLSLAKIAAEYCHKVIVSSASSVSDRIDAMSLLIEHGLGERAHAGIVQFFESNGEFTPFPHSSELLRWSAEKWPEDLQLLDYLAQSLAWDGENSEAANTYQAIASRQMTAQDFSSAFDAYRKAIALNAARVDLLEHLMLSAKNSQRLPDATNVLEQCAKSLVAEEKHVQAIVPLLQLESLDPSNREYLEQLARSYKSTDQAAETAKRFAALARLNGSKNAYVEQCWEQCIELSPDDVDYLRDFARFLIAKRENPSRALDLYRRLLNLMLPVADASDVAEVFAEALAIAPEDDEIRDQHLDWLMISGQTGLGIDELLKRKDALVARNADPARLAAILRRLVEFRPDDVALSHELATTCNATGNAEAALAEFHRCVNLQLDQGDQPGAIDTLKEILAISPADESANIACSQIYLAQKKTKDAVRHLRILITESNKSGDLGSEEKYIRQLLDVIPDDLKAIERLAELLSANGNITESVARYETLLAAAAEKAEWESVLSFARRLSEVSVENLVACRYASEAFVALGNVSEAVLALQEYARLAEKQGVHEEAKSCWLQLETLDADNPELRLACGQMFERTGDVAAALQKYEQAVGLFEANGNDAAAASLCAHMLELGDNAPGVRQKIVEYRLRAGQTDEALRELIELAQLMAKQKKSEELNQAIVQLRSLAESDPTTAPQIFDVLCKIKRVKDATALAATAIDGLLKIQQVDQARQLAEQALAKDPENPELREMRIQVLIADKQEQTACTELMTLGETLLEKGNASKAEEIFFRVVQLDAHNFSAREALVTCFLQTKRSGKAFVELKMLARTYQDMGKMESAISCLHRALELRKDHQESRVALVEILLQVGRIEDAKSELILATKQPRECTDALMQSLNAYLERKQNDFEVLRLKADLVAEVESFENALPIYRQLASSLAYRSPDQATALYQDLLGAHAERLDLRREYARFLAKNGNPAEAAGQWLILLNDAIVQGDNAFAGECADEARKSQFISPELRKRILSALSAIGNEEAAAETALAGAESHVIQGDIVQAEDLIRQAVGFVPKNIDVLKRGIKVLHEHNLLDAARELSADAARRMLALEREEDVLDICQLAENFGISDPQLLEVRIDALERTGTNTQIVEACGKWANILTVQGSAGKAEAAFKRGLAIKDQEELRLGLAELLCSKGSHAEAAEHYFAYAAFWRKGMNASQAREALEKAVQLNPTYTEAHLELGQIYSLTGEMDKARESRLVAARLQSESGDDKSAIDTYAAIIRSHPEDVAVYRMMIEAASRAGDIKRYVGGLHALAKWLTKIKADTEAIAVYRQVLECTADDEKSLKALTSLYGKLGDTIAASEMIERRADLLGKRGDIKNAITFYREAIRLEPSDSEMLGRIAKKMIGFGEQDQAIALMRTQSDLLIKQKSLPEATACLREIIGFAPDDVGAHSSLAECLEKSGNEAEAAKVLAELATRAQSEEKLEEAIGLRLKIRALMPLDVVNLETLMALHEDVGQSNDALSVLSDLADAHENRADFTSAIRCCKMLLERCADERLTRGKLARCLVLSGSIDDAIIEFERVIDIGLEEDEFAQVEEVLDYALSLQPNNENLRARQIDLLVKQGKHEQATEAMLAAADSAVSMGDSDKTVASLERLSQAYFLDGDSIRRIIDLCDRANLTELGNQHRIKLARVLLGEGQPEEAKALCDEAIANCSSPKSFRETIASLYLEYSRPELAVAEYLAIANLYYKEDDFENALKVIKQGLHTQPGNLHLLELAIAACSALDLSDQSYEYSHQFVERALAENEYDMAESVIRRMIKMRSQDPLPQRWLVDLLHKMDRREELQPSLKALARLFESNNQMEEAWEQYRLLVELAPDDIDARKRLIDLSIKANREIEVIEDYLVLAEQMAATDQVLEATQIYERLLALAPENVEARTRFIQFLSDQGQHTRLTAESIELAQLLSSSGKDQQACKIYEKALQVMPKEQSLLDALAETYSKLRLMGKSLQTYRRLLAEQTSEKNVPGQIATLGKILELDRMDIESRSALISLLRSARENELAAQQSMLLADLHLERGFADLAEQTYRELLNYNPTQVEVWKKVIETHLSIGDEEDLVPDFMILGDLLARQGEFREACETFKRAIKSAPTQIAFRLKYIETSLRCGSEAELVSDFIEIADRLAESATLPEAIEWYDRALKQRPAMKEVRKKRDALAAQMGVPLSGDVDVAPPSEPIKEAEIAAEPVEAVDAIAENKRKELEKAIRIWQSQLRMGGGTPELHIQIAEAEDMLGAPDRAYREWDIASSMYLDQGDVKGCIKICKMLLDRDPEDRKMKRRMSMAQSQLDSLRAAEKSRPEREPGSKKSRPHVAR